MNQADFIEFVAFKRRRNCNKDVSEQSYEAAYPTVTVSANKVHVGFYDSGIAKTRDKNFITNTWESIQTVYDHGIHNVYSGGAKLFSFS